MSNKKIEVEEGVLAEMIARSEMLSCLEQAGVDSWEGFSFAMDIMQAKSQELTNRLTDGQD